MQVEESVKHFRRNLKPIVFLGGLAGVAPITESSNGFITSQILILYNCLLIILYVVIVVVIFSGTFIAANDLSNISLKIVVCTTVSPSIVFILVLTINSKAFVSFLRSLETATVDLSRFGYKVYKLKQFWNFKVVARYFLCVILSSCTGGWLLPATFAVILLAEGARCLTHHVQVLNIAIAKDAAVLNSCHMTLMEAAHDLNLTFAPAFAHLAVCAFTAATLTAMRILQMLYQTEQNFDNFNRFTNTLQASALVNLLIILLHACQSVSNQVKETGKQIHKRLLSENQPDVREMLISTGTTYLVILIQFDQTKTNIQTLINNTTDLH